MTAVRDTPAAAAAWRSVAPLALAAKNLTRTSAGFGLRPTSELRDRQEVRIVARSCVDRLKTPPVVCDYPAAGG